jgi:transcriptional regulator of nitric oxide reductase
MDGSAYVSKQIWNRILTDYDLNEHKLRDSRYDLVIHLSSAADGAMEYYTLGNN